VNVLGHQFLKPDPEFPEKIISAFGKDSFVKNQNRNI